MSTRDKKIQEREKFENHFEMKLKQSDGVFSSSDSLDTDEILSGVTGLTEFPSGVNQFNSPKKVSIPIEGTPGGADAAPFAIKSRKPPQRRGQVQAHSQAPPNTVSITRRNIPSRSRHSPKNPAYHRPSRSQVDLYLLTIYC